MNYRRTPVPSRVKILLFLGVLILVAVTTILVAYTFTDETHQQEILVEMVKGLLQVLLIAIGGGIVSMLLREYARQRDVDRVVHNFRLTFLRTLRSNYYKVKSARRLLRSVGLTHKFDSKKFNLTKEQADYYKEQMTALNAVQMELEQLKIEAKNFCDSFTGLNNLAENIEHMEEYVRGLLREYEKNWPKLNTAPSDVKFCELDKLRDYTNPYKLNGKCSLFAEEFCKPFDKAILEIRRDLLPLRVAANGTGSITNDRSS